MTWVKICGITNLGDALAAVEAGADALGFVFYDKSARKVEVAAVREMIDELPGKVEKVGVFVDQTADEIRSIAEKARLTAVQLHGKGSLESVWKDIEPSESLGVSKVIPVFPGDRLKDGGIVISPRRDTFAVMLDAQSNGTVGGSGVKFDWNATRVLVQAISLQVPVVIAGGLNSTNVLEALRLFQPFGVDVSSGVEAGPGKKDPAKVRAFISAIRRAENNS